MFKVSKLGIDLMDYKTISVGKYKKNRLIKFNSKTQLSYPQLNLSLFNLFNVCLGLYNFDNSIISR